MAASIVRACLKQRSSIKFLTDIAKNDQYEVCRVIPCELFNECYHTSAACFKRRKEPQAFVPKPKPTQIMPVVGVWKNMTVMELSEVIGRPVSDVLQAIWYSDSNKYTKHTVIENRAVIFDAVKRLGAKYKIIARPDEQEDRKTECDVVKRPPPDPSVLIKRRPIVTVMGHVDHGKTTLLDSLRNTSVVASEFGGITQHIGAFNVTLDSGEKITFLDTPGHAAFSAMRARGANATDIVILVVAADDGVMEQTIQSISMARDANVPIIVAINKIDKPVADIDRTIKMLSAQGIHVEAVGGDVPCVQISALKGTNLKELVETVAAQAEIMNLQGDPKGLVEGVIIEVTTEVGRGKLATALVQRGTLRKGSILVAGLAWAKVRAMFNHEGTPITEATLSDAVQIIGWRELPSAGDEMLEVESERRANVALKFRNAQASELKAVDALKVIQQRQEEHNIVYKELLQQRRALGRYRRLPYENPTKMIPDDDGIPNVNVIIKADVIGSAEAILDVLDTYGDENRCRLNVVHYGIGAVCETDIEMAQTFNGIVYTFNTNTPRKMSDLAEKLSVPIHSFKVIYKLIDDLKNEICKKLPPGRVEEKIGEASVLQQFEINEKKKKVVNVAGCRCTSGILKKNELYKILRNYEVIYDGKLETMRHLKTEVNSIKSGVECGLQFKDPTIQVMPGDTVICYTTHEVPPSVHWDPGF